MAITARRAIDSDAAACSVVRRSIQELCVADHQHDPATIAAWLESKSLPYFQRLIQDPASSWGVAVHADQVYPVHPDFWL